MLEVIGKINLMDRVIVPFTRDDLSQYKKYFDAPVCEICHTNHIRTELYIIREDDKTYVAGSGCMRKKFGKTVVARAIKDGQERLKTYRECCWNVFSLISAAIAFLNDFIYIPNNTDGQTSSSALFKMKLREYYGKQSDVAHGEEAKKIIEHYLSAKQNPFVDNVCQLITNEWCSDKVLGMFPAVVNGYRRSIEREHEAKNEKATEYFGNVGDKVKNANINVEIVFVDFEVGQGFSYWDQEHIFVRTWLRDVESGHMFVWNNGFKDPNTYKYIDKAGTKIKLINFTIKNQFDSKHFGKVNSIIRPKYELC